ncbi:MAG: DNA primase [Gemmatimonadales bacterium]
MSGIPDELIEQVRDSADMVHLIGEHVDLRRTGSDYRGACPFHGGQRRNFAVIPRKQMFYCFVCHEAGDVFSFYMKKLGMDYPTAVREVASKTGISIPERPSGGPDPNEPLYSAVSVAVDWYAKYLRESDDAEHVRSYVKNRGFDITERPELGFGFAPKGDDFLSAMNSHGLSEEVLAGAGLVVRREDGSLRPRFWNRLLIPIMDLRGRVVGFGGRLLTDGEPKYLNSPESRIFHKGRLLYNLHNAKQAIRKHERAVVVEGYFDVLALLDVGVENTVAALGTAFTPDQAVLLERYTKEATILYDSDSAGLKATFRSADEMLRVGLRVTVATLPAGEDPDSLARRGGAKAINSAVADAVDILERKLQMLSLKGWLGDVRGRRRALDKLIPSVRAAKDEVTRDLYVSRIAEALGTTRDSVAREATQQARVRLMAPGAAAPSPSRRVAAFAERELIRVLIHEPAWRGRVAEQLGDTSVLHQPEGGILEALFELEENQPASRLMNSLEGESRVILAELLSQPGFDATRADEAVASSLEKIESRARDRERAELDKQMPFLTEAEKKKALRRKKELRDASRGKGVYRFSG